MRTWAGAGALDIGRSIARGSVPLTGASVLVVLLLLALGVVAGGPLVVLLVGLALGEGARVLGAAGGVILGLLAFGEVPAVLALGVMLLVLLSLGEGALVLVLLVRCPLGHVASARVWAAGPAAGGPPPPARTSRSVDPIEGASHGLLPHRVLGVAGGRVHRGRPLLVLAPVRAQVFDLG